MHKGILIGMAIGAVLGAAFVEGNAPASELVHKSKKCVKEKVDAAVSSVNAAKNAAKNADQV